MIKQQEVCQGISHISGFAQGLPLQYRHLGNHQIGKIQQNFSHFFYYVHSSSDQNNSLKRKILKYQVIKKANKLVLHNDL